MKPALKDGITKRGHKFDEHVCSRRAKSTRNWSFLTPGYRRATGALVFHVSLHWEHRFRRVVTRPPFAERPPFARMHVAAAFFFSPRRVASSLKSMQIFHEALFVARARPPTIGEKKSIPTATLLSPPSASPPSPLSRRGFFSFCRRCPTWRYVKRIYNWRYDGQALESNTSILIPTTYAVHPRATPPTRPCHFRGNPSNVKAHPGRSAFTVWILNLYRTVERSGGKYAGRDEQKRIFLRSRVLSPSLPTVFTKLTILYFAVCIWEICRALDKKGRSMGYINISLSLHIVDSTSACAIYLCANI